MSIAIEVPHAHHLPGGAGHLVDRTGRLDGQAIHQVDEVEAVEGTRAIVAPQDIALAIAIEVAEASHLPIQICDLVDGTLAEDGGTVHEVDDVDTGGGIAPEDVGLAIAVEVAEANDAPVGGDAGDG